MNLIPESNGLKKISMKKKKTPFERLKRIAIIILAVFTFGFVFQLMSNFIGKEKISSRLNYARIDGKKMEYKISGSGDYTIVFDGAIGANLYEWNNICKRLEKELDVQTFVYNRSGYGFSDGHDSITPNEQAEDLKTLLRKAGVSGKVILVGEEYGSLVMTNFAKLYPDSVAGMILVKPFNEENIKTNDFRKSIRLKYYKSKLESVGTSFGLTSLLNTLGLTYELEDFEDSLPKGADEEYLIHKNKKNYRQAIANEISNLYKYTEESQVQGLIGEKPLYIISNDGEDNLKKLSSGENVTVYKTESESNLISINNEDSIFTGIQDVLKTCRKLDKKK